MAFGGFKTGIYVPTAGKCKYTKVVNYRSSYELAFCQLLDAADKVVRWDFESMYLGYTFHGRKHHYLVDFYLELDDEQKFLIEIKPKTFYDRAMLRHDRNWFKWESAISFCRQRGWQFKVITEQSMPALRAAWLNRHE